MRDVKDLRSDLEKLMLSNELEKRNRIVVWRMRCGGRMEREVYECGFEVVVRIDENGESGYVMLRRKGDDEMWSGGLRKGGVE